MISDEIKDLLGLEPTGIHVGTSFMHNREVCLWPISDEQKVFVLDCDLSGYPLPDEMLLFYTKWGGCIAQGMLVNEDVIINKTETAIAIIKQELVLG